MRELIWTVDSLRPKIVQFLSPVLEASSLQLSFDVFSIVPTQNLNLGSHDLTVTFEGRRQPKPKRGIRGKTGLDFACKGLEAMWLISGRFSIISQRLSEEN